MRKVPLTVETCCVKCDYVLYIPVVTKGIIDNIFLPLHTKFVISTLA